MTVTNGPPAGAGLQETTKKGRSRWPLGSLPSPRSLLRTAEIDTRMLGMLGALALIWISFHFWSGGTFLTPRNLWNLSVQTSAVAIMATGMVLIIVSQIGRAHV